MAWLVIWMLACGGGEAEPSSSVPSTSEPTGHTGSQEDTGSSMGTTGETGQAEATGETGTTAVVDTALPPDCATYVPPMAPGTRIILADVSYPTWFAPRADGSFWFASGLRTGAGPGIYEGMEPPTATFAFDVEIGPLVEDPTGVLYVLGDGVLHRVPPGGTPEVVASGLGGTVPSHTDLTVHPAGTVVFGTRELGAGEEDTVTAVLADGTVLQHEVPDVLPRRPYALAYDADRSHLWGLDGELFKVEVDAVGVPDWSTRTVETLPLATALAAGQSDLLVDACDGVWVAADIGYGQGRLARYDPHTGTSVVLPGNLDFGYGGVGLRFDRAPGSEHQLRTMTGGWSQLGVGWLVWDVGIGEAPWP